MKRIDFKILFLILCLILIITTNLTADKPDYCGIWGIWNAPQNVNIKNKPWYKGSAITIPWNKLEPEENEYNWELLDEKINTAYENGHYIMFWIFHGRKVPE